MYENYKIKEPDVISEEMGNEVVVINLETGHYYSLNETAALIWSLISEGLSCQQIFNYIAHNYAVEKETAIEDAKDLLIQLINEALIVESNTTGGNEKNVQRFQDRKKVFEYRRPHIEKHYDMQEMLKLDPIHEVTEVGWPNKKE